MKENLVGSKPNRPKLCAAAQKESLIQPKKRRNNKQENTIPNRSHTRKKYGKFYWNYIQNHCLAIINMNVFFASPKIEPLGLKKTSLLWAVVGAMFGRDSNTPGAGMTFFFSPPSPPLSCRKFVFFLPSPPSHNQWFSSSPFSSFANSAKPNVAISRFQKKKKSSESDH